MKIYKVKRGFMAYQFDKPTYCVGIEMNALRTAGQYHCVVGKEEKEFDISYDQALGLVEKYGEDRAIRRVRGKRVFIVPIKDFVNIDIKSIAGDVVGGYVNRGEPKIKKKIREEKYEARWFGNADFTEDYD